MVKFSTKSAEDLDKYYRALARAQADIDTRHDLYTHYFEQDFPERFQKIMVTPVMKHRPFSKMQNKD